jgi:hypothetical protein
MFWLAAEPTDYYKASVDSNPPAMARPISAYFVLLLVTWVLFSLGNIVFYPMLLHPRFRVSATVYISTFSGILLLWLVAVFRCLWGTNDVPIMFQVPWGTKDLVSEMSSIQQKEFVKFKATQVFERKKDGRLRFCRHCNSFKPDRTRTFSIPCPGYQLISSTQGTAISVKGKLKIPFRNFIIFFVCQGVYWEWITIANILTHALASIRRSIFSSFCSTRYWDVCF